MTVFFVLILTASLASGDNYFDITDKIQLVNAQTCHLKTRDELHLPSSALANVPSYIDGASELGPSRSLLEEAGKMALNRAVFYSFINQKLNDTHDFQKLPDLVYDYLSAVSSITAGRDGIVGAGIYYDRNTYYPNWYTNLEFNRTVNMYAPFAMRTSKGLQNLAISHGVKVEDDSIRNYTNAASKTNDWFYLWLPDSFSAFDTLNKLVYEDKITEADNTTSYFNFFAVNHNQEVHNRGAPVRFTAPYFDCGRTNKWIVTAVAPVTDFMPRYTKWQHLRRPRFIGVSTVDVDFTKIDINQCPLSKDNPPPNMFANTHFCKPSSECKPVSGLGFQSGGYECVCGPGYEYADKTVKTPYQGVDIEQGIMRHYIHGYECIKSGTPIIGKRDSHSLNTDRIVEDHDEKLKQIQNITARECDSHPYKKIKNLIPFSKNLTMHFQPQARQALRLSHFLSSYLQTSYTPDANSKLKLRHVLIKEYIQAEATAIILSDLQVSSVFVNVNIKLPNGSEEFLKIYAYKNWTSDGKYGPLEYDFGSYDVPEVEEGYRMNMNRTINWLEYSTVDSLVKATPNAKALSQMSTWKYKVPSLKTGGWGTPDYGCYLEEWTLLYALPITGPGDGDSEKYSGSLYLEIKVPTSLLFT